MRVSVWALAALTGIAAGAGATEQTVTYGPFGTVALCQNVPQPTRVVPFVSGDGGSADTNSFHSPTADPAPGHAQPSEEVGDLPLVEVPAAEGDGDLMAVMLSGDGGWAGLDREVSTELAKHGVPVVGWNSLQYFWTARDPAGAAADLDRVLRHYLAAWDKRRVLLAGYSLGADVLPFLVNRLPAETRAQVAGVVLIGCSHTATFQFHLGEWLGGSGRKDALQTAPEIRALEVPRVLCFYGQDETDTVCPELRGTLTAIELPGGHHFGGDYAAVARQILQNVATSGPPSSSSR